MAHLWLHFLLTTLLSVRRRTKQLAFLQSLTLRLLPFRGVGNHGLGNVSVIDCAMWVITLLMEAVKVRNRL